MSSHQEIVEQVATIVRQRMAGQQAGHGIDHLQRVLKTAKEIQAEEGGDALVVELAAWLHDIGDAKFCDGVERSAEFSHEILTDLGLPAEIIDHVAHIVDNISFRKGSAAKELSLEGKIVQDADRLDALGAIGIVRTIEYGATMGQPFHVSDSSDSQKTGVGHFHEKLFKLRGLLNTAPARRIAGQREQFMQTFLDQFFGECGEVESKM
jgi:uncharacterized protein